ncbi:MAG: hypothetical protein ACRCUM_02040 [Mycoplasmoidaceae bacterium]
MSKEYYKNLSGIKGYFKNCYGLSDFNLINIPFYEKNNKAIIYAQNGVMKSSLALVFDNLSKKKETIDRFFINKKSKFEIQYYDDIYTEEKKEIVTRFYVVNSFNKNFEAYNDSVSTILANDDLKKEYTEIIKTFTKKLDKLILALKKYFLQNFGFEDEILSLFCGNLNKTWENAIKSIKSFIESENKNEEFYKFKYNDIFNEKTIKVISTSNFISKVKIYMSKFDSLLKKSKIFSISFDDYNSQKIGEAIKKNNFFSDGKKILLKNGDTISSIKEWEKIIKNEMSRINKTPSVEKTYNEIKKMLNANNETRNLWNIIKENRNILNHFKDLELLKKRMIISYVIEEKIDIVDIVDSIIKKEIKMEDINKKADHQFKLWKRLIKVFNERFRVPFEVFIDNKEKVILNGEPARLKFKYKNGGESIEKTKNELMNYMSVSEKRALYLLQILFDLEKIKNRIKKEKRKHLVIVDDIADSFDYTNKYAIIEYLNELSENNFIDLLILTHNFDFYRAISSRLNINEKMSYIVQKDKNDLLHMEKFKYKNDYFKNVILKKIRGEIKTNDFEKEKLLIASIPFFRNILEYLKEDDIKSLMSLLHIKNDTFKITVASYLELIKKFFNFENFIYKKLDKLFFEMIFEVANKIVEEENNNSVSLENKLVVSIAIRLKIEQFLEKILKDNGESTECKSNQTRIWAENAWEYLSITQKDLINKALLITPEYIHINSFMYEPLIDAPNWQLYELYNKIKGQNIYKKQNTT